MALMDEVSTVQEIGKLSDESFLFKEVTWKIPINRILPNEVDYDVASPTFSFAGATWILHIYPYGRTSPESVGWIELVINRLDYTVPQQTVFYKFYFKTYRGKKYNALDATYVFDDDYIGGWLLYMPKDHFFIDRKGLSVKRFVILVCEMRTQNIDGIEMFSQTESVELYSRSPVTTPAQILSTVKLESPVADFKEPLEKKLMEKPESFAAAYKESPEIKSTEKHESSAVDYKESSEKESTEKPESPAVDFKGSPEKKFMENPESLAAAYKELSEKKPMVKLESPASGCKDLGTKTLQDFKDLFLRQKNCDIIIKVKGQEFPAHRNVLAARSPAFASTYMNDMKEKATDVIDIEDCDPSSFSEFLRFLYCGDVENLSTENAFSLFTAADKYDVQDLRSKCLEFIKMNLSLDTFCSTITLALRHSERVLIELTTDFFVKNLPEIIVTVEWQSFLSKYPMQSNALLIKALVPGKR